MRLKPLKKQGGDIPSAKGCDVASATSGKGTPYMHLSGEETQVT